MPRYRFHCVSCDHETTARVPMGGKPIRCPECGEETVIRFKTRGEG